MNMYVAFVEHTKGGQPFLFDLDRCADFSLKGLHDGDEVVCETRYGEKKGAILTIFFLGEEAVAVLARACGAKLPLSPILRKYEKPLITSIDEVPAEFVEQIKKAERKRIMDAIKDKKPAPLPFDDF